MCFANSTFAFQKRYLIDPDIVDPSDQYGWAMHQLGVLRRNQRTKLKKIHCKRDMTKEQVLAKIKTVMNTLFNANDKNITNLRAIVFI